jgi:hypothetical protein
MYVLAFVAATNVTAEIFTADDLQFLLPLPENPNMVGYATELKESMLPYIREDSEGFAGVDFRMNGTDNAGFIISAGLGIPIRLDYISFYIPFFWGATLMFDTMGELLDEESAKRIPPQGWFLNSGLFVSGRYGHLGFTYDWFNVGGDNRYIMGNYASWQIYARTNLNEIPYVGKILAMIDGYFSIDQFLESFSTDTGLNDFKSEYRADMLFKEISLGEKAGLNVAAFSQKNWYDMYAKYEMQGGKIYLSFGSDEFSTTLFADIAYRKFFDVLISPKYSIYEDGMYLKCGILLLSKDDGLNGYFQFFAESGRAPWLSKAKYGVLFGFNMDNSYTLKATVVYPTSRYTEFPVNGALSLRMCY